MKKILFLSILLMSTHVEAVDIINETIDLSCIKNNAKRIKNEPSCQTFTHQLNSIPEPSCFNGRTTHAVVNIMTEARKNSCIDEPKSLGSKFITQPIQRNLELSCIKNNAKRIKPEPPCQTYLHQLNSIPEPNCFSGKTTHAVVNIMTEARKNSCIDEPKSFGSKFITQPIQRNLELSCIKGNAKRIKTESSCQTYLHQLNSIPQPSCFSGRTTHAVVKIMTEARENSCVN